MMRPACSPTLRGAICLAGLVLLTACVLPFTGAATPAPTIPLRVGYFPNFTHSQAVIGIARGDFAKSLPASVVLEPKVFNAGPDEIEAMFANQLDLAYIGPSPAINGYLKSGGQALRIIAGATSGGAALVVRPAAGIHSPADLSGKRIADPQLGNTQDVALRSYLSQHGLKPAEKGGTVTIVPVSNPEILQLFRMGQIDGAWVPEPWASELVVEGGGTVFVDERNLWPNGQFSTAVVVVTTSFLRNHPEVVKAWLQTHVAITLWERTHPDQAKALANQDIGRLTGQGLSPEVLDQAWNRMEVTYDPLDTTLVSQAQAAQRAGYLQGPFDLSGLTDLTLLNQVLSADRLSPIP
ncbi:MAG: ABC transporter substrate-binding protein [Anaerolineales bacterium]|jgi:NitT/TauT family transport system substrate-binding protein